MTTNFVLGDSLSIEARSPKVQKLLDDFWAEPDNHMATRVYALCTELSLYGEQFIRFFVNPYTGRVKIAQLDPSLIDQIQTDPDNVERAVRFHQRPVGPGGALWSATAPIGGPAPNQLVGGGKGGIIRAPSPDAQPTGEPGSIYAPGDQVMAGTWYEAGSQVVQFKINSVSNAKRGKSDLATILPWLRRYQEWLIDRVRINKYKAAFLWDIKLSGADARTIDRKRMQYAYAPSPGSVVVHNESEEWTAVQPKIAADDVEADGKAIKLMVAAGAGLPEHWLAEGGDVNRACYSADTETLTESGWKCWQEIGGEERIATYNPATGSIEYHRPIGRHIYPYEGEMIHFQAKGVDVLVTPDHDMWVQIPPNHTRTRTPAHTPFGGAPKHRIPTWEKRKAETLATTPAFRFLAGADYRAAEVETFSLPGSTRLSRGDQPERHIPMDLWLEFLGYMVSEGCIYTGRTTGSTYKLNLAQKKEAHAARIASVLARLPFAFAHQLDAGGVHRWQVADKALWTWLREHVGGKAHTKRLPHFVGALADRQQRILFEALMLGDGTTDGRDGRTCRTYSTCSPGLAGDVQALALRLGMRTSLAEGTRCIRVLCSDTPYRDVRCNHVSRVPYSGIVYCFEVPNHLFVTRRNGAVAIHGNTAAEMGLPTYRKLTRRQRVVEQMLRTILDRVIAEAIKAGALSERADCSYRIELPELTPGQEQADAQAAATLMTAMTGAMQARLISRETGMRLLFKILDPTVNMLEEEQRIQADSAAPPSAPSTSRAAGAVSAPAGHRDPSSGPPQTDPLQPRPGGAAVPGENTSSAAHPGA